MPSTIASPPGRHRRPWKGRFTWRMRHPSGKVASLDGRPIANATLDLWQTDGEGLYEAQRDVTEPWMRGIYRSQPDGSYVIRTVAPIGYTIPMDGPVGEL